MPKRPDPNYPDTQLARVPAILRVRGDQIVGLEDHNGNLLDLRLKPKRGENGVAVMLVGGYAYVRTAWSNSEDTVQKIGLGKTRLALSNSPVDLFGLRKIPVSTRREDTAAAWESIGASYPLLNQGDEAGPMYYNGTYIAGNHGPTVARQVTIEGGHGKTALDIGSRWDGPYTPDYVIVQLVDDTRLVLLSTPTATGNAWSFENTNLNGKTLTHKAGAFNTAPIVVSTSASAQLLPILSRRSVRLFADEREVPISDCLFTCGRLSIREQYDVVSPAAAVAYLQENAGRNTNISICNDAIDTDVTVVYKFVIGENGAIGVDGDFSFHGPVTLGYIGMMQALAPYFSGKSLGLYVPGMNSFVAGSKTYDLAAIQDITTGVDALELSAENFSDPRFPPSQMCFIVSTGGVRDFGFALGYSPVEGAGSRYLRSSAIDSAGAVSTSRKLYPKMYTAAAFSGGVVPSGTRITGRGYRAAYNAALTPDATVAFWYYDGDDIVVIADFHKASTGTFIKLPPSAEGWTVAIIEAVNVTVPAMIVDGGGLGIVCNSTSGRARIKVCQP